MAPVDVCAQPSAPSAQATAAQAVASTARGRGHLVDVGTGKIEEACSADDMSFLSPVNRAITVRNG